MTRLRINFKFTANTGNSGAHTMQANVPALLNRCRVKADAIILNL
ncbi:hypothetical protein [Acinetobacter sp. NS-4]